MKNNNQYWIDRTKDHIDQMLKDEDLIKAKMSKVYRRAIVNIQEQIDAWLSHYAAVEHMTITDAKQRVTSLDIEKYKRKAKTYVEDKVFTKKANEEMRLYNLTMKSSRLELLQELMKLEVMKLGSEEERLIYDLMDEAVKEEYKELAAIFDMTLIADSVTFEKTVREIVNGTFHYANFSDNVWANKRQLLRDLQTGLERTLLRGENPRKWTRNLYKSLDKIIKNHTYAAERLAITEMSAASIRVNLDVVNSQDFKEVIVITEPTACSICKEHDGDIVRLSEARMGDNIPLWHPYCRCSIAGHISD